MTITTDEFLTRVTCGNSETKTCTLKNNISTEEALKLVNEDIYFLSGVKNNTEGRAKDTDISEKNHIMLDFDIRKDWREAAGEDAEEITTKEMLKIARDLFDKTQKHQLFKDLGTIVFTGNGVHFYYYFEEEIQITNTKTWRSFMQSIHKRFNDEIKYEYGDNSYSVRFVPDPACINAARISRLPGTFNNKTTYKIKGLGEFPTTRSKCEVIYNKNCKSALNKVYEEFAKKEKEKKKTGEIKAIPQISYHELKKRIQNEPIEQLVNYFGIHINDRGFVEIDGEQTSIHMNTSDNYFNRFSKKSVISDYISVHQFYFQKSFFDSLMEIADKYLGISKSNVIFPVDIKPSDKAKKGYQTDYPHKVAKIVMQKYDIISNNGNWFVFNGNIWETKGDSYINNLIFDTFKDIDRPYDRVVVDKVFKYMIDDSYKYEDLIKEKMEKASYNPHEIPVKEGIYNYMTEEIRRYEKEDFYFYKFNYSVESKSKECPNFHKFLETSLSHDNAVMLQQWFGLCFVPYAKFQKILMLYGEGGNGKSVALTLLHTLLGNENVCSYDLKELQDESYRFGLIGKLANICADIAKGQQIDTAEVKKISSGDLISAREKFKQPINFIPYTRLIFSANDLPYIRNTGNAIQRRLHLICFDQVFDKDSMDKKLPEKLNSEKEAIFWQCVTHLKTLMKNEEFTENKELESVLNTYITENDVVTQWIEDNGVTKDDIHYTTRKDAYTNFNHYCKAMGKKPAGNITFNKDLEKKGFTSKKTGGSHVFEMKIKAHTVNAM